MFDIEDDGEVQEPILVTGDLYILKEIFILKKVRLQDALVITVQTAQHVIRLRQNLFEPLFNEFSDKDLVGTLGVTTTFYQAMLHLARCHTYLGGLNAQARQQIS